MNDVKFLARGFAPGVFLHRYELPGDIRRHRVRVVARFDAGRGEEAFRNAIQFRFGENNRRFGVDDVCVEIGA